MDSAVSSSSSSTASSSSASAGVAPGRTAATSRLAGASAGAAAGSSPLPPELAPLVGLSVTDGAGYVFVLEPDGSFLIIGAPRGKEGALNKRVRADDANANLARAWQALAAKLASEHPTAAPATTDGAAPAEGAAAPEAASPLDGLLAGITGAVQTVTSKVTSAVAAAGTFVADLLAGLTDAIGGPVTGGGGENPGATAPAAGGTATAPAGGAAGGAGGAGAPAAAAPAGGAEAGGSTAPAPAAPSVSTPGAATGPIGPGKHQSRSSFIAATVPASALSHPTTSAILDSIWPYFDEGDHVIGAFLSPGQQAWKVNYHWELVIWVCDAAQKIAIGEEHKATFAGIASTLRGHAPSPSSGYLDDGQMSIVDSSDQAACDARYAALKTAKVQLGDVIAASGASGKVSGYTADRFKLAPQYVKSAGTSKHGTGYAFDIKGDNARIAATAATLGRSGQDDEDYHVHVEFAGGVKAPAAPPK